MKYLLILQLLTFSSNGEVTTHDVKLPYASEEKCQLELNRRIEEWKRAYETSTHVGIIGKCVGR